MLLYAGRSDNECATPAKEYKKGLRRLTLPSTVNGALNRVSIVVDYYAGVEYIASASKAWAFEENGFTYTITCNLRAIMVPSSCMVS